MAAPAPRAAFGLLALLLGAALAAAQGPKAPEKAAPTNPRGEPLLFESGPNDVRVRGLGITSVAVAPDGTRLVTTHGDGGGPGEVRIWDRATGRVLRTIAEPQGVRTAAFTPDGKVLATGNFDGTLRLYDPDADKPWAASDSNAGGFAAGTAVNAVCFFRGGKYLAAAGANATVRVWDVEAARAKRKADGSVALAPVVVIEGHAGGVNAVAAPADGRFLLTGADDQTARVWDLPATLPKPGGKPLSIKHKERAIIRPPNANVAAVAVSPDGRLLVTGGGDGRVLSWDRDGRPGDFTATFTNPVGCLAFSPDGAVLAAGPGNVGGVGQRGEVRVWDVAARRQVARRTDYPGAVTGLALTPDGKTVVTTGSDGAVHLWPVADPKARQTFTPPGIWFPPQPLVAAAVSPGGEFLAFATENRGIFVWHRKDAKLVAELTGHTDHVSCLAFSPDGHTLASASHDGRVKLWNPATWAERRTLTGHAGWVFAVAFSPDGKTLATGGYDRTVRLWDAVTGEPRATWKDHAAGVRTVAFSPDGKTLASGSSDRTVRLWDVAMGQVIHTLKGHKGAVRAVAFSPDGQLLASGAEDRTAKLWDPTTGKELRTLGGLPDMAAAVAFSPKGQTLLVATFNGAVTVWDPPTGRKRQSMFGHGDAITAMAFTDAGRGFVTVSRDETIKRWDAVPPPEEANLVGRKAVAATAVAVPPAGQSAVLGKADGSVTAWDFRTGNELPVLPAGPARVVRLAAADGGAVAAVRDDGMVTVRPAGGKPAWSRSGRAAAYSPDGRLLAVADGKAVVICNAATGREVRKLDGGHDGPVTAVAFDPEGKVIASAGADSHVRLWTAATGTKREQSPSLGIQFDISGLAFRPDGKALAVVGNTPEEAPPDDMSGQFRVIRSVYVLFFPAGPGSPGTLSPGSGPPPMLQHLDQFEVSGAAWVGGNQLVTTQTDGSVRLWDVATPQALAQPSLMGRAHDAPILAAAGSAKAGLYVTAGEDGAVKRWRLPAPEPKGEPPGKK